MDAAGGAEGVVHVETGDGNSRQQGKSATIIDSHSVWAEGMNDRNEAEAAVRAVVQDAMFDVGLSQVPDHLRDALRQQGIGWTAGDGEYRLQKGARGTLDWRRRLRRYVGRVLSVQPDFGRPPRRFPELVGIVLGKR